MQCGVVRRKKSVESAASKRRLTSMLRQEKTWSVDTVTLIFGLLNCFATHACVCIPAPHAIELDGWCRIDVHTGGTAGHALCPLGSCEEGELTPFLLAGESALLADVVPLEFGTNFTHVCDLLENPHWDFIALPSQGFIHLRAPQCAARCCSQTISSVFAVDRELETPVDPNPASPLLSSSRLTSSTTSGVLSLPVLIGESCFHFCLGILSWSDYKNILPPPQNNLDQLHQSLQQ